MPVTLLRAGPGGGKSTALVRRAVEHIHAHPEDLRRLLFVVHEGVAVERMRAALDEALGAARPVPVATYEALAQQILQESRDWGERALLDPQSERLLVAEAIRQTHGSARRLRQAPPVAADEDLIRNSPRFRDDVADFLAELKRCQLNTATFRRLISGLPQFEELSDLADIYEAYQRRLESAQLFDNRGVLWLALLALQAEPALAADFRARHDLLLADDLQDATALQVELLAAILSDTAELVATFESAQCIYRFRGAVQDPTELLTALLPGHTLRTEIISSPNPGGPIGQQAAAFAQAMGLETPPGGAEAGASSVQIGEFRTLEDELGWMGDRIIASLQEGVAAAEIAVIARGEREVRAAAEALAARGIPVAGERLREGLWAARQLLSDMLTAWEYFTTGRRSHEGDAIREQRRLAANAAVRRIVTFGGAPEGGMAQVAELAHQAARRDLFLLDRRAGEGGPYARLREVFEQAPRDDLPGMMLQVLRAGGLLARLPADRTDLVATALLGLLEELRTTRAALQRTGVRRLSPATARALLQMAFPRGAPGEGVAVITAHQARGRSFRRVFLIAVNEERFPAPPVVSRIFDQPTIRALRQRVAQHLGPATHSLTFAGFGEQLPESIAEERRIFYLCLTRARERLAVTCHLDEAGSEVAPSGFFLKLEGGPAGRIELPSGSPAAPELPAITPPTASGIPVLAGLGDRFALSASALSDYQVCPRRFFLGKLLRLREEESDALAYGSAVHDFLRRLYDLPPAEREPQADALLTEALERLRGQLTSPTALEIYRERAEQALAALRQTSWFLQEALALEQPFRIEVVDAAGATHWLQGRIDAVLATPEGLAVVDHKSGKIQELDKPYKVRRKFVAREQEELAEPDYQLPLYALAWEQLHPLERVAAVAYQRFFAGEKAPVDRVSVALTDTDPGEADFTREELEQIRARLAQLAGEIKRQPDFPGHPPKEGCSAYLRGCAFALICEEHDF